MKTVHVHYYAVLREARGRSDDAVQTSAATALDLYNELRAAHGFRWTADRLKVAINDELKDWRAALEDGDDVAFLPPVAGG